MRDRVIDAQNDRESGHEQDPSGRWSQSEFRRLRNATDPEIERVVSAYQLAHPELADARELVRSMIQEVSLAEKRTSVVHSRRSRPSGNIADGRVRYRLR
jgi:hypothetical protein